MEKLKLLKVHFLPNELESGILFVSKDFGVAGHLCPCGCMSKVITPLGQNEWSFSEVNGEPTLSPSIGNWQLPCRSHYWIKKGKIIWSDQWSEKQIREGYLEEELQRKLYYEKRQTHTKKQSLIMRVINWFFSR